MIKSVAAASPFLILFFLFSSHLTFVLVLLFLTPLNTCFPQLIVFPWQDLFDVSNFKLIVFDFFFVVRSSNFFLQGLFIFKLNLFSTFTHTLCQDHDCGAQAL